MAYDDGEDGFFAEFPVGLKVDFRGGCSWRCGFDMLVGLVVCLFVGYV